MKPYMKNTPEAIMSGKLMSISYIMHPLTRFRMPNERITSPWTGSGIDG